MYIECHECQVQIAIALGVGVFVCTRHPATGFGDLARRGGPRAGGTASSVSSNQMQPGCAPGRIQCRDGRNVVTRDTRGGAWADERKQT